MYPRSFFRVQKLEDELEPHCEEEDIQVASAFSGQLLKNLEVTKLDLEACKDCWEEGISRLEKLAGKQSVKSERNTSLLAYFKNYSGHK